MEIEQQVEQNSNNNGKIIESEESGQGLADRFLQQESEGLTKLKDAERMDCQQDGDRVEEGEPEGLGLCPRCSESVYLAESRLGANGTRFHVACYTCKVCNNKIMGANGTRFHVACYTCKVCNKCLDSMNVSDGPDGEIYCEPCHKSKFYNQTPHAVHTDAILVEETDPNMCINCHGKVFELEKVKTNGGVYHKACLRCVTEECQKHLDSTNFFDSSNGKIYCEVCYKKVNDIHKNEFVKALTPNRECSPNPSAGYHPSHKCPRCSGEVYAPEKVHVGMKQWHKACLVCEICSAILDAAHINETGNGEQVYCPKCYKNSVKYPLLFPPSQ